MEFSSILQKKKNIFLRYLYITKIHDVTNSQSYTFKNMDTNLYIFQTILYVVYIFLSNAFKIKNVYKYL